MAEGGDNNGIGKACAICTSAHEREIELGRNGLQAPIVGPQFAARGQPRGGQQVGIHISDATPE